MTPARLIVEARENWAVTFWLTGRSIVRIGRGKINDVCVSDPAASGAHAEIALLKGRYYLRDLKSRNGTWLNDQRVEASFLKHGDVIRIGNTTLQYLEGEAGEAAAAPDVRQAEAAINEQRHRSLAPLLSRIDGIDDRLKAQDQDSREAAVRGLASLREEIVKSEREFERAALEEGLLRLLKSAEPLNKRLDAALALIAGEAQAENGFIMTINPQTRKWVVRALYGDIRDWDPAEGKPPLSLSVVAQVVKSRAPLFSDRLEQDARLDEAQSVMRLQIKAVMCAPMIRENAVFGVVYLDRRQSLEPFADDDRAMLECLTKLMAQCL